jgi:microcystin-dependent protein
MFCEGQLLAISENETLFNLIGTIYGGDGQSTFALPDMRGRLPIHEGAGFVFGETGGAEEVTITVNQLPAHTHSVLASSNLANSASPTNNILGTAPSVTMYFSDPPNSNMRPNLVSSVGGAQPHNNFQPYLCVDFIISLFGIFPSPS